MEQTPERRYIGELARQTAIAEHEKRRVNIMHKFVTKGDDRHQHKYIVDAQPVDGDADDEEDVRKKRKRLNVDAEERPMTAKHYEMSPYERQPGVNTNDVVRIHATKARAIMENAQHHRENHERYAKLKNKAAAKVLAEFKNQEVPIIVPGGIFQGEEILNAIRGRPRAPFVNRRTGQQMRTRGRAAEVRAGLSERSMLRSPVTAESVATVIRLRDVFDDAHRPRRIWTPIDRVETKWVAYPPKKIHSKDGELMAEGIKPHNVFHVNETGHHKFYFIKQTPRSGNMYATHHLHILEHHPRFGYHIHKFWVPDAHRAKHEVVVSPGHFYDPTKPLDSFDGPSRGGGEVPAGTLMSREIFINPEEQFEHRNYVGLNGEWIPAAHLPDTIHYRAPHSMKVALNRPITERGRPGHKIEKGSNIYRSGLRTGPLMTMVENPRRIRLKEHVRRLEDFPIV